MADMDKAADASETELTAAVRQVCADVANEFGAALGRSGSLTAAAFSVSSIAAMWSRRARNLVEPVLAAYEAAARWTATAVGSELPPGWDDLPDRTPSRLPEPAAAYLAATEQLLDQVGADLAERARRELAAGTDAEETPEQLKERLLAAFAADGPQLGPARAERIARTEATRVWNAAALAAATELTGPDRPLVKQWVSRGDSSVRSAHRAVNGQLRLLDETFTVAGVAMSGPGDPAAPPALTVNCRCRLQVAARQTASAVEIQERSLKKSPKAREPGVTSRAATAADGAQTGAMIALIPTPEDATRLALDGGEPADELHLTLYYLGDADGWTPEQQDDLTQRLRDWAAPLDQPVRARAFGANRWNADTDNPVWVWAISDDPDQDPDAPTLTAAHEAVTSTVTLDGGPATPAQHTPWQPHVTAAHSSDPALLDELETRLGPLTFDRVRVAFAGQYTDIPLGPTEETPMDDTTTAAGMPARPWSTPEDTAIAFENQETGDGRIFAPGSLHWGHGPWPLQYADEMLMGHEGAELAGAIQHMGRDGDRITASGVLYSSRPAGADAVTLLDEAAPLGISVDLDDVDIEVVDRTPTDDNDEPDDETGLPAMTASLPSASLLRMEDGAWSITIATAGEWTASGAALSRTQQHAQLITEPGGRVSATALRAALASTGALTAAAGDSDTGTGTVVHTENSGDVLLRITRARVRGATLVAMPAYDRARIVLDPDPQPAVDELAELDLAAASDAMMRVVRYVSASPIAVGSRETAAALGMTMSQARSHLARAATEGRIVRLARGLYVGASVLREGPDITADMSGDTSLPIHPERDYEWAGDAAASRVLEWATGDGGAVDPDRLGAAFLWRDPDADPATLAAYKLGVADLFGDELHIVPRAVFAIAGALQGARGGVDIPEGERDELRDRVEDLYARLAEALDDPELRAPWDEESDELAASAWTAMRDAEAMPAGWFKEPTAAELPPGSGGVHYKDGRIYGWVAQAGEPHAGFPGKNLTIESLGKIDTTHFLRARFALDDGTSVRAGALTMNAPHGRDGAECETAACQFDDTRTVAGIVTVGMSSGGMWFSGAAGPWLSEWDRSVFQACQPSYHMKQGPGRRWQLRAVLSVPVPGHSSPLLATAVAERSNLALAASAAPSADVSPHTATAHAGNATGTDTDSLAAALTQPSVVDALLDAIERKQSERAAIRAEIDAMTQRVTSTSHELAASAATSRGAH